MGAPALNDDDMHEKDKSNPLRNDSWCPHADSVMVGQGGDVASGVADNEKMNVNREWKGWRNRIGIYWGAKLR